MHQDLEFENKKIKSDKSNRNITFHSQLLQDCLERAKAYCINSFSASQDLKDEKIISFFEELRNFEKEKTI